MEAIIGKILSDLGTFLFGPIMLAVFFGVGLYFTIRLKGIQFTRFRTAFREVVWNVEKKSDEGIGQIRSYKALATALSSCVGNGNIVGVAYAIAVGGPGAIFWMWIAALGGMATKFAEIALAMHFRVQDEEGNFRGGVMYILTQGMKQKTIAKILGGAFAVFTVFVSFVSCGALQVNTISSAVSGLAGGGTVIPWIIAILILVIDGLVIFGGVKKIADVTTYLTPIMALIYLGFGLVILIMNITLIPQALWFIVKSAFSGDAVIGGVAGATMSVAIRRGVQRGVFSNARQAGALRHHRGLFRYLRHLHLYCAYYHGQRRVEQRCDRRHGAGRHSFPSESGWAWTSCNRRFPDLVLPLYGTGLVYLRGIRLCLPVRHT